MNHAGSRITDINFGDLYFNDRYPNDWASLELNGTPYASCQWSPDGHGIHDPDLVVSAGRSWSGWHVDNEPALPLVTTLLAGHKIWFLCKPGRHGWKLCSTYARELRGWLDAMVLEEDPQVYWAVQEPGTSIYLPANWVHAVLSRPVGGFWTSLLGHCLWASDEELAAAQVVVAANYVTGHRRPVQRDLSVAAVRRRKKRPSLATRSKPRAR